MAIDRLLRRFLFLVTNAPLNGWGAIPLDAL
jgi:hypothetical protein